MQPLFKIHIWLTFAILFLPFKELEGKFIIIILTANLLAMIHEAIVIQRTCIDFNVWEIAKCWGHMLANIGKELLVGVFFAVLFGTFCYRYTVFERTTTQG